MSIKIFKNLFRLFSVDHQKQSTSYEYQKQDRNLDFDEGVEALKERLSNQIIIGNVDTSSPEIINKIQGELLALQIEVERLHIDLTQLKEYLEAAEYKKKYPSYYLDNFSEKTLEHFISYKLMALKRTDKFVDIASEHSPLGEIMSGLSGCSSYSQDIMYEPGLHERKIGSDASKLPVDDNFFNGACATCSIEHFEKDADIRFMKEMQRVLAKGGKIIIAPLYLYLTPSCQTDPQYSVPGKVEFDAGAVIHCAKGWGNRHARFYSPQTLQSRLIGPNKGMSFKVIMLDNIEEVDASVYCRFLLVGRKL